jgi:RNA 3'-terminal phosphate cyclase (ATP)
LVRRCGPEVRLFVRRPGFYPVGGGEIEVEIEPCTSLKPLEILRQGGLRRRRATARVANLDVSIAQRELAVVRRELGFGRHELVAEELSDVAGAGNVLCIEHEFEEVTDVSTGFGQRGVPAEKVAREAVRMAGSVVERPVPVGIHLADQLLLPLAMAGAGAFRTLKPSRHTDTNAEVIAAFLPVRFAMRPDDAGCWRVEVQRGA